MYFLHKSGRLFTPFKSQKGVESRAEAMKKAEEEEGQKE